MPAQTTEHDDGHGGGADDGHNDAGLGDGHLCGVRRDPPARRSGGGGARRRRGVGAHDGRNDAGLGGGPLLRDADR